MGSKTTHFPSDLEHLQEVRRFVEGMCSEAPADLKEKLALAIDEAFSNVVQHSHPPTDVILEIQVDEQGITLILKDQGDGFDPSEIRPPDFSGEKSGGFGLYIIEQIADRVTYLPKTTPDGWNELQIFRRL